MFVLQLLYKFKIFDKRVMPAAYFSGYGDGAGGCLLPVEEIPVIQFDFFDSIESPHKIQMPVASAEFPVGDDVVSGCLLFFHQLPDGLILRLAKLGGCDGAGLKLRPRLFDGFRAEKASHIVVSEL